jgi:hypothetical protein
LDSKDTLTIESQAKYSDREFRDIVLVLAKHILDSLDRSSDKSPEERLAKLEGILLRRLENNVQTTLPFSTEHYPDWSNLLEDCRPIIAEKVAESLKSHPEKFGRFCIVERDIDGRPYLKYRAICLKH